MSDPLPVSVWEKTNANLAVASPTLQTSRYTVTVCSRFTITDEADRVAESRAGRWTVSVPVSVVRPAPVPVAVKNTVAEPEEIPCTCQV